MNKLYRNYETPPTMLWEEFRALQILELLLMNKPLMFIENSLSLVEEELPKLVDYQDKLVVIQSIMHRLVKGTELNLEGSAYPLPQNLSEMKIVVKSIINTEQKYGLTNGLFVCSSFINYNIRLDYIIQMLVTSTNDTNSATYEWWMKEVIENE